MLSKEEVLQLSGELESDRIERTISVREDKIGEAVCAFSNDFPNHKKPGYILLGINDDGKIAGLKIGDKELQTIGDVRSNGNVLPQPSIIVGEIYNFTEGDVVAIEVLPSFNPPVRWKGRCFIRIGPRKAIANPTEERMLSERRTSMTKTFDAQPNRYFKITDLNENVFFTSYLPQAVDKETIASNNRSYEEKLAGLRLYDINYDMPTNAGALLLTDDPEYYFPGAYIQYVKFPGVDFSPEISNQKKFSGPLGSVCSDLDSFISNVIVENKLRRESMREINIFNYPLWSLREFTMNAILHRDYESNAPIYIYEYSNRVEIINPGGLFGDVNKENFPYASDYRNPVLAEILKNLGFVNRFNYGIRNAQEILRKNGSPLAEFDISLITKFFVTIHKHPSWL